MRAWRSEHSEVQTRPSRPMTHSQSPERSHRDERSQSVRKRSRSREREHQGRSSADRGAVDRRPHGHTWGAPPPLLSPPAQDAGVVLSMSASHGRAISADGLRPNAAALDSRALTQELGRASTLTELLSLEQSHGDRFDHFNLVSFWSKFKKLPRGELGGLRDRLAPVCELTVRMLPTLSAREVANLSHALAGLVGGSGPWENVWAALPSVALRLLVDFDPQHLANTAWAFAKAGHVSAELFNAISAEVVRRRLRGFNSQALSNTAWAFATASHASAELFDAISAEVVCQRLLLGTFTPQALSNTAWAFAKAGHAPEELFNAISTELLRRRLNDFDLQNLTNILWAFATSGRAPPELFNAVSAEVVRRRLGGSDPRHLSNLAWTCAAAGHASAELFNAISAEAVRRLLSGFNSQSLSNTAWAFATARHASAELFDAISAKVTRLRLGDFDPQALCNTAWAFATAGHASHELFDAISARWCAGSWAVSICKTSPARRGRSRQRATRRRSFSMPSQLRW